MQAGVVSAKIPIKLAKIGRKNSGIIKPTKKILPEALRLPKREAR